MIFSYKIIPTGTFSQSDIERLNAVGRDICRGLGGTRQYIRDNASSRTGLIIKDTPLNPENISQRFTCASRVPEVEITLVTNRELELEEILEGLEVQNLQLQRDVDELRDELTLEREGIVEERAHWQEELDEISPRLEAYDCVRLYLQDLVTKLHSVAEVPYEGTELIDAKTPEDLEEALKVIPKVTKSIVDRRAATDKTIRGLYGIVSCVATSLEIEDPDSHLISELGDELTSAIEDLYKAQEGLTLNLTASVKRIKELEDKNRDEKRDYQSRIEDLDSQIDQLNDYLDASKLTFDHLNSERNNLSSKLQETEERVGQLDSKIENQKAAYETRIDELDSQLEKLSSELDSANESIKLAAEQRVSLIDRQEELTEALRLEREKSVAYRDNRDAISALAGGFTTALSFVAKSIGISQAAYGELTTSKGISEYTGRIIQRFGELKEAQTVARGQLEQLLDSSRAKDDTIISLQAALAGSEAEVARLETQGNVQHLSSAELLIEVFNRNFASTLEAAAKTYNEAMKDHPEEIQIAIFPLGQYVFSELREDLEQIDPYLTGDSSLQEIRNSLSSIVRTNFTSTEYFNEHNRMYKFASRTVHREKLKVKRRADLDACQTEVLDFVEGYEQEQASYLRLQDRARTALSKIDDLEASHARASAKVDLAALNIPCETELTLHAFTEQGEDSYKVRVLMPIEYQRIQEGGIEFRLVADIAHALKGRMARIEVNPIQDSTSIDLIYQSSAEEPQIRERASRLVTRTQEELRNSFMGSFVKELRLEYLGEVRE